VQLNRPLKLAIGALTVWPVVYMFLFMAFVAGTMIWMGRAPKGGPAHSAGVPLAFFAVFAAHFATILLTFGLIVFYIVFLFKTDRVPQDKKALWAAVLFLGAFVAMPVFFYLYVWPDQWPSKTGGSSGAPVAKRAAEQADAAEEVRDG
jgi:hypothetical protein